MQIIDMNGLMHPSKNLSKETIEIIRENAAAAENAGRLLPAQLALIAQHNWFNLFVPDNYGGLSLSLPEAVRLEESIAWADGSLGWVVTLCSGAAMFIGFFEDELAREVFSTPNVCLAGSGQSNGTARWTKDGYKVDGIWPYASGAPHATHFTANCIIEQNGEPIRGTEGKLLIKSFVFKKEEVFLEPNWHYIGLNATAGHSFSVSGLTVPENRSFIISADHAQLLNPVYHYPFLQMAEATLAVNTSGMCICFMDMCKDLLLSKTTRQEVIERGLTQLSAAESDLHNLRRNFYSSLDISWQLQIDLDEPSENILKEVSVTSRALACGARKWVNVLYPYCGLAAARYDAPINQVWRNIHTASQHSLLL